MLSQLVLRFVWLRLRTIYVGVPIDTSLITLALNRCVNTNKLTETHLVLELFVI